MVKRQNLVEQIEAINLSDLEMEFSTVVAADAARLLCKRCQRRITREKELTRYNLSELWHPSGCALISVLQANPLLRASRCRR